MTQTQDQKLETIRKVIMEARGTSLPEIFLEDYPIRLSDILIALSTLSECYAVDYQGSFMDCDYEGYGALPVKWDLHNDDLNLQQPETISFLFDLLCKKYE